MVPDRYLIKSQLSSCLTAVHVQKAHREIYFYIKSSFYLRYICENTIVVYSNLRILFNKSDEAESFNRKCVAFVSTNFYLACTVTNARQKKKRRKKKTRTEGGSRLITRKKIKVLRPNEVRSIATI